MNYYELVFLSWNAAVVLFYGIDKLFAKMRKRRISESALLICAFLMGGMGAMFGMVLFNHKTSKMKFRILVPMAIILQIAAIYLCLI